MILLREDTDPYSIKLVRNELTQFLSGWWIGTRNSADDLGNWIDPRNKSLPVLTVGRHEYPAEPIVSRSEQKTNILQGTSGDSGIYFQNGLGLGWRLPAADLLGVRIDRLRIRSFEAALEDQLHLFA